MAGRPRVPVRNGLSAGGSRCDTQPEAVRQVRGSVEPPGVDWAVGCSAGGSEGGQSADGVVGPVMGNEQVVVGCHGCGSGRVWCEPPPACPGPGLMIVSNRQPRGIDLRIEANGGWCGEARGAAGSGGGRAPGLPVTPPGATVEVPRSQCGDAIAGHATGALDLRGAVRRLRAAPRPSCSPTAPLPYHMPPIHIHGNRAENDRIRLKTARSAVNTMDYDTAPSE